MIYHQLKKVIKINSKKQYKNVTLILKNYLAVVTVIKEKETWSIKVTDVKTRPFIDNYVFKSLTNTVKTNIANS